MPSNWTSTFASPRRKKPGSTQGSLSTQRFARRADSTVSVSPQQNNKTVKMIELLEERQRTVESLDATIDNQKAEMNMLVNKLQYANIEIKQNKAKLHQKSKEICALQELERDLRCSLQQSQNCLSAAQKSLAVSEACRSNATRELARYRQNKPSPSVVRAESTRGKMCGSSSSLKLSDKGDNCTSQVSPCLDISGHKDVVVKAELHQLMVQVAEWRSLLGTAAEVDTSAAWLEHVHSQLGDIMMKL